MFGNVVLGMRALTNPFNERIRMQELTISGKDEMTAMKIPTRRHDTAGRGPTTPLIRVPSARTNDNLGVPRQKSRRRKSNDRKSMGPEAGGGMSHSERPVIKRRPMGMKQRAGLAFQTAHQVFATTVLPKVQGIIPGRCCPLDTVLIAKQT